MCILNILYLDHTNIKTVAEVIAVIPLAVSSRQGYFQPTYAKKEIKMNKIYRLMVNEVLGVGIVRQKYLKLKANIIQVV